MDTPDISIPKAAIAEMPTVTFPGVITVVDTPEAAAQAVEALSCESLVGFDTETKPSFRKGQSHPVALMQVSTDNHSYLFRLNILGMNPDVKRFIENDNITKIGLSLKDDFFIEWATFQKDFSTLIRAPEKAFGETAMRQLWSPIFGILYLCYDLEKEFLPQFRKNTEELLCGLRMIANT